VVVRLVNEQDSPNRTGSQNFANSIRPAEIALRKPSDSAKTEMVPRQNRVDPWGDLHAVRASGMFTGNRGCLVGDGGGPPIRHHNGSLWIICETRFRDWRHPLDAPRTWTPLFFLDDAVGLAAGHRPCGLCRRVQYLSYRAGVTDALAADTPVLADELNRRLAAERLRRGRGLSRARDRLPWQASIDQLPVGTVVLDQTMTEPRLLTEHHIQPFTFDGWGKPTPRPSGATISVLTPQTSVAALANGFVPTLHHSAAAPSSTPTVAA
jgi:hypothetical protein